MSGERPLTVRETLDDVWTRLSSIDVLSDRPAVSRLAQEAMTLIVAMRTAQELSKLESKPAPEPGEGLRAALYAQVGKRLTDARVDELARAEAIPLHGRPVDIQARYLAARIRREAMAAIDAALEAAAPEPTAERLDVETLRDALAQTAASFHAIGWHDRPTFGHHARTFEECPIERCVQNRAALARPADETGSER